LKFGHPKAIANATCLRILAALSAAVPVRLMERDMLFILRNWHQ
jgi:hypothetical protein